MGQKKTQLEPGKFYHIYNHSIGKENLFRNEENYRFFLSKFFQTVSRVIDTYAYCLMPNHYHFLILVKDENAAINFYKQKYPQKGTPNSEDLIQIINKQLSNCFNGYSKAYNKIYKRKGALFIDSFGRKEVKERDYLVKIVHYIHYNPVHHKFVDNISDWKYSSYNSIINDNDSRICRKEVIELFENIDNFIFYNQQKSDDLYLY